MSCYCKIYLPNAGLCHRLFTWARAKVFCKLNNIFMLAPMWMQVKLGPFLRRENDKRIYNHFDPHPSDIRGFKKIYIAFTYKRSEEPYSIFNKIEYENNRLYCFKEELKNYFYELNGQNKFLMKELTEITKKKCLETIYPYDIPIGVHIRRSDFQKQDSDKKKYYVQGGYQTPISWFIHSLQIIRQFTKKNYKAIVFSDGCAKTELYTILQLPNVSFYNSGFAISDLLSLSKSKILIGSRGSSFTAWATFLGQMPTIVAPGEDFSWFNLVNSPGKYLGTFNPLTPNELFLNQCNSELMSGIKLSSL